MEDRIVEFATVLRRNGVRVSLAENMDAFRALQLVGVVDPLLFRNALRTTLVKRSVDLKPFEELFDFYFFGIGQPIAASWKNWVLLRNSSSRCSNRSSGD